MTQPNAYIEALAGRAALAGFTPDELRRVVESATPRVVHSGEPLWSAGEPRESVFILVSGRIERVIKSFSGRRVDHYAEPGALLSLVSLAGDWPYQSSAYALDRSEVLCLSRDAFLALFEAREPAAYHIVDALGEYLVADMHDANERLQQVFGHPAETLRGLRRRVREDSKA